MKGTISAVRLQYLSKISVAYADLVCGLFEVDAGAEFTASATDRLRDINSHEEGMGSNGAGGMANSVQ